MNIPLVMALLAGRHRHRYNDNSGCCSICSQEHNPHDWEDGQCRICGYSGCEHTEGWINYDSTQHRCKICGQRTAHVRNDFLHEDIYCQSCRDCAAKFKHSFSQMTDNDCGICNTCGDIFGNHIWKGGVCQRCGYQCKHSSINADQICNICSKTVVTGAYHVFYGTYKGSYISAGRINGQSYYRQHQYNADTGQWVEKNYYLVVINIKTPTQFGGNYAYTGSGAAFVTSVDSFSINDSLLSGNGRYNIHLEQYSLDGNFIAEGNYTSADCADLSGKLP